MRTICAWAKLTTNMVSFKSLFIDDLCVDKQARGQHIGESLFEYVKQQAKELGCYEVTLNVWTGNTSAEHFYEKNGHENKGTADGIYPVRPRPWSKPDTTYALVRDGQFLTQSIQSDKNQEVVEDIGSCQKRSI